MSKEGQRLDLHVVDVALTEPKYWTIEGSTYRRSTEALQLSVDDEAQDALPAGRTKEIPIIFRQVLCLTPGNWNGLEDVWTDALIEACAANHSRPRPLQKDHSRDADDNHGKVLDLIRMPPGAAHPTKPGLVALIGVLGSHAIERVEDGRWDEFSVGVWCAANVAESYLMELSFTKFPACDDVKFLHQSAEENSKKDGADMAKETDKKVLGGGAAAEEQQEQKTEETVANAKDAGKAGDGEVAELRAKLAAQEAEVAELRRESAEAKKLRDEERVGSQIIQLTQEGYSSPAVFDKEKAFMLSLDETQRAGYVELRREQGKVWRPGRQSDPALNLNKDAAKEARDDADAAEIKALIRK